MKKLNLRKISIICCLLLVNVCMVSSQIKVGIKGGIDVAENKISKGIVDANNRLGFQIGAITEFTLPIVGWGIDASLLYGYKDYDLDSNQEGAKLSNYNYLMVPVNIKKRFSLVGLAGVYLFAGPYAEFKLSGGDFSLNNDKLKSKEFGAGLNFGAGVNLLSTLDLGMTYRLKLTDNYGDSNLGDYFSGKKDNTWNVNLTYYFR